MSQENVLVNVYLNEDKVPVVMRLAILRALEREWAWQGRSVISGPHDGKPSRFLNGSPSFRVVVTPSPRRPLSEEVRVRDRSR